jgi:hypothetical protein
MTLLNIIELRSIQAYPTNDTAQIAAANIVTTQELTPNGSTSTVSAAFGATQMVRLCADTTVGIAFSVVSALVAGIATGSLATANATSLRLVANIPEYLGVTPGQVLAVILRS